MVSQEASDIMPEEGDIVIEVQPDNGTHISSEDVQDVLDFVDECFSHCRTNNAHLPAHEGITKKRKLSQPSSFKKQRISEAAGSSTPWSPLYGGTRLDEDTIQYLHKFYCKDCQMDQQAAERARAAGGGDEAASPGGAAMDVKQESPLSPEQVTDDASISGLLDKNKESLKRKLMMRRSLHELVDQGIYPPPKTPPAFMEQRKSLERAKTGDLLRYKIQHRPDRQVLVQQHILEDTNILVDPSLHERQRLLKKARLTDSLNDKLSHRPGILELVQGNILQPDGTLHQLIKDGSISFDKTCDEDDQVDDKSSDEAFSPDQTDDSNLSDISSPPIPPAPGLPTSFAKSLPFSTQIQFSQASRVTTPPFSIPQQTSPSINAFSLSGTSLPSCVFSAKLNTSVSSLNNKSRPKKQKPKTQPKTKVIKFHEYKGPPNVVKSSQPVPTNVTIVGTPHNSDTPYHILLQQQQLFLQWQLEFNQKQNPSSVPVILPAHKEGQGPPTVLQVAVGTSGATSVETSTPESKSITVMSHTSPHTVFTMNTPHKAPGALPQIQQIRIASPAVSHIKQEPAQVGQPQPQMNPQCSISQPVSKPPVKRVTLPSPTTNLPAKHYTSLEEMKVAELKAELKKRNLPVSGPKPVLIEKLKPYADSILKCMDDKCSASVSVTSPDSSVSSVLSSPGSVKSAKVGVMSPQSMVMSPPPLPALSSASMFMSQPTAVITTSAANFSRPVSVPSVGPPSVQSVGPASVQSVGTVSSPGSVQSSVNSSVSSPPGSVGSYQSSVLSRPGSIMSPLGDIIDETLTDVLSPLASIQSMQSAVNNVSNISPTSPLFMDMPLSPDLMDLNITSPPDYSVSNNNLNKSLNASQTNVNSVNSVPVEMEQSRPPSVLSLVQSETGKIDTAPMDIDLSLSHSLNKGFLDNVGCMDNVSRPNSQPSSVPVQPSPQPSPQLVCPSSQSVFIPSPPPLPTFNQKLLPGLRPVEQQPIPGSISQQQPAFGQLAQPQVSLAGLSPLQQPLSVSSLSPTQQLPCVPLGQPQQPVFGLPPTPQPAHSPSPTQQQQVTVPGLSAAQQQQQLLLQQIQTQLLQQTQQVEQLQQEQQQQKQQLGEPGPGAPRHLSQEDLMKQQQNKIEALQSQLEESQLRLKIQQLQHQQLQQQQQQLQQQAQQLAQLKQQQAALEQSQKQRPPATPLHATPLPSHTTPLPPQATPLPPQTTPLPQVSPKPGLVASRPMQISTALPFPVQAQQPVQAQTHAPMQQIPAPAPAMSQAQGQTRPPILTTRTPQPTSSVQNPQSPPQVIFNVPSLPNGAKVSSLQNVPPNTKQIQIPAHLLQDLQNNQGLPIIVTQNPKLTPPRSKAPSLEFIKNQAINQTINLGAGKSLISVSTAPGGVQHFIITTSVAQKGSTPTCLNGLSQPPQSQKMATSLPSSPVEARPVSRTSSNPFFIPMREPPKYDEAVKNKHPPPQASPSPLRPGGGAAVKSQAMDDVLEILIRTGELPESAAQEPPPTPKTTSQTATIPTVTVVPAMSRAAGSPGQFYTPGNRMSGELAATSTGARYSNPPPAFSSSPAGYQTTTTMSNSQTSMADYFAMENGYAPMDNTLAGGDIKLEIRSPPPPDLVPAPPAPLISEHNSNSNDFFDLNDVISSDLNSMDWSSDPAFGDLDFADTTSMAMDVKFSMPSDNSLLSIPMASSPHKSSHGSEPDLANLGLGDMDTNTNMQIDVPDWLDVIMPSTGLTPLSATAPVAFPADPILTPRTQQEVLDLFNFDDSDLNTPSDLNSGSNWDKLTGTTSS